MILELTFSTRLECALCSADKICNDLCEECPRLINFRNSLTWYRENTMRSKGEMCSESFFKWIHRELKESIEIGKEPIQEFSETDTPQDLVIKSTNNYSIHLYREKARYLKRIINQCRS